MRRSPLRWGEALIATVYDACSPHSRQCAVHMSRVDVKAMQDSVADCCSGLGRDFDGGYAEYTCVSAKNVQVLFRLWQ